MTEDWISHCHSSMIEFSWTVVRRNLTLVRTRDSQELIAIGLADSLQPWQERTGRRCRYFLVRTVHVAMWLEEQRNVAVLSVDFTCVMSCRLVLVLGRGKASNLAHSLLSLLLRGRKA